MVDISCFALYVYFCVFMESFQFVEPECDLYMQISISVFMI